MSYQYPPNQQQAPYGYPQGAPPQGYQQGYQQPPYPQQQYGAPQGAPQGAPHGAPPPQGHYPPPQGYGQPPQQQQGYYGTPSPQPPAPYGAPPAHHAGYPPQTQQPPPQHYGQAPPSQHYPPQHGQPPQGFAPPPQGPPHGAPIHGAPSPYGAPMGAPAPPSLGYVPGQVAPGDFRAEADTLRKAMKGFGTDEKALIQVLSRLDPLQMAGVRATYTKHIGRDLYKDVKSETGGYLEQGLLGVIEGPLMFDVACAREAVKGAGTKEWLLNDILLGRSNADLHAIQTAYERTYHRKLARDVEDDLSFKTADLFKNVLHATRHEDSVPINPQTIEAEVRTLHNSTAARVVNNVAEVCGIFARSSNAELREIDRVFQARYHTPLDKHIEKEFSGHMEDALLHMLRTATDPAMRDAILLEECMAGMGTKDERLVVRVVRVHWDRQHKETVKRAYRHRFGKDLIARVREETSRDYEKLMVALLE
ncbi:Putative Annexin [Penicillium brasilianum]|uniref:Annexin n=1 Tax=Penicillium brasilianum TaxID=104259 RepID=A0A0F7VE62_PENBI|nr:Putative Annexin [Penicillium brasilianum]